MSSSMRCLLTGLALAGAALLASSDARADTCQRVGTQPFCRQCVADDSGGCCHSSPPCYCVYDQCLPLTRTPADEIDSLALAIFSPQPSISPILVAPATPAALSPPESAARESSAPRTRPLAADPASPKRPAQG